jgi:hypothetical protein
MLLPFAFGSLATISLVPLLGWDAAPTRFPRGTHDVLGATPLVAIAAAHLAQQCVVKPSLVDWLRAIVVVSAFGAWAVNQYWPDHPLATVWNDVAIALFVIDIFVSIARARATGIADRPTETKAEAVEGAPT